VSAGNGLNPCILVAKKKRAFLTTRLFLDRRSRSGYLPGPTSLSPKEPLQRDGVEPSESYDEDEQSLALDLPLASKRRASGARATESRKGRHSMHFRYCRFTPFCSTSDNVSSPIALSSYLLLPVEDAHGQTSILESRSNQSVRGGAQWRVQTQPHKDIASQSDKPRSAPDSLSQQKGYFESTQSGPRRSSGTNRATEGMSHMNLNPAANSGDRNNSNLRSEQWMDEYRQDRGLAISPSSRHDSSSIHGHSMDMAMEGVLHPTSVDGLASDQMVLDSPSTGHYSQTSVALNDARPRIGIQECSESTEGVASTMYSRQSVGQHQEGVRRASGSGQRREVGQESTLSVSQGMRSPQRHSRDHPQGSLYAMHDHPMTSHNQSFPSRSMPSESHYSYAQRQGYASSGGYRSVDYGASGSYPDDSHRGSVSSNPYDRSDYPSRSQADTPSHFSASFHASGRSSHYPPAPVWEQQHSEGHLNEQQSAKARPSSHHDPYPGFKQQTASDPPHPLSHGKYHGVEGMDPLHSHNEEGHCSYTNKCAKNQLAPPSHVRYPSQGHSYSSSTALPKEHSHREDTGTIRKLSLTTSPTRPHEHRSQSLPHLTNVPPQKSFGHPPGESFSSGGYTDYNREHEEDSLRQPSLTSSGPFLHQDSQGQSLATPPTGGHFVRGNPGPYTSHIQESTSTGGVVSRTSAFEHGPDGRPVYAHGRSMSSSNIHRSIYPAGSTASGSGHLAGVGVRSTNPPSGHGQGRGSQYDSEDSVQGGHSAKSFLVPHSSSDHYRVHNGGRTHLHDTIHAAGLVPSGLIQTKGPHPPQSHPQHESHQHSQYQRLHPTRYHSQHFPEPSPQHGSHSHPPTYPSQHSPGVHDNYGPPTVVQNEEGTRWPM